MLFIVTLVLLTVLETKYRIYCYILNALLKRVVHHIEEKFNGEN